MTTTIDVRSRACDFDFSIGGWTARNRRLREPLSGADEWDEFESRVAARPLPGGLGSEELYCTGFAAGLVGMSFRFFDPETGVWSVYWVDSDRPGALGRPVFGSFEGGEGVFLGEGTFDGRPILVRHLWTGVDTPRPRWERAFSDDDGETWETNWIMELARVGEGR